MIGRRNILLGGGAALAAGSQLARPALAQAARVLKFVPQANLANPDPIWTSATVAHIHGHMVWEMLYGIDDQLIPRPQMVAGHELSSDSLTWRLTLRDGLKFHDNEPVRAIDCITSINRWSKRNGFGQQLASQLAEMKVLDDKRFEIRLTSPFPHLPYALGAAACFIMPERIAKTDAFTQIPDYVGSGPFRFLRNEWVAGASAAYARFEGYVPRQEPPSFWSGGKVAHFDRVEWQVLPDPSTAAAALQRGEVDWVEQPLFDLVPTLRKSPGIKIDALDRLGNVAMIVPNHVQPPFDNPKLLRALLPIVNQEDFVQAVVGDQADLGATGVGVFTPRTPSANTAGMEVLTSKRDLALAKKLIAESGYKGEPILLMSPSDQPALATMAQVTEALFKSVGLNVQFASMDWGTLVQRRTSKELPEKGGWSCYCTTWAGLSVSNPGSHTPLRGNGLGGHFGWPTDPKMEEMRSAWFQAPDAAAQKKLCEEMQLQVFKNVPFIPVGQWFYPTAYRSNLSGFVRTSSPVFWNVRRT
ncbi:ABC transporter substrate-binding protein [Limobrevibacterium gyesilva]|uniref:ABC transporter substrate-binding protein n=1 Tax=Limobrevibacterium gyesilva TaxID=2991712 RepID=A0AA41YIA7_9PROT|nr:ABC transporter substrate-binding protein [Limobrevibacterium gyesilva]MCW3474059.1 ABC transporter substrate-binding protein [Limobrevibacterium gyesilva]